MGMGRARAAIPALSRAQTQGDPFYSVYRAHRDLPKGSTARELGWRLALHKTIEERERAPASLDRSSLPLVAQMRSADRVRKCLLFGVDRTDRGHHETDAFDPEQTLADAQLRRQWRYNLRAVRDECCSRSEYRPASAAK